MADTFDIKEVTLDMSLDDLDDLPQFLQPPTGAYIMTLPEGIVEKTIELEGKEPLHVFEAALKIKAVGEIEASSLDTDEEPPKPGDTYTATFNRTNQFGMGAFKEFLKPIAKKLGQSNIGVLIGASKGMELGIVMVRTYDKKKQRNYSKIRKVEVL